MNKSDENSDPGTGMKMGYRRLSDTDLVSSCFKHRVFAFLHRFNLELKFNVFASVMPLAMKLFSLDNKRGAKRGANRDKY